MVGFVGGALRSTLTDFSLPNELWVHRFLFAYFGCTRRLAHGQGGLGEGALAIIPSTITSEIQYNNILYFSINGNIGATLYII